MYECSFLITGSINVPLYDVQHFVLLFAPTRGSLVFMFCVFCLFSGVEIGERNSSSWIGLELGGVVDSLVV